MATYYNTTRMGLAVPLRGGRVKLVAPRTTIEIDPEDEGSSGLMALVRQKQLVLQQVPEKPAPPPPAPAPAPAPTPTPVQAPVLTEVVPHEAPVLNESTPVATEAPPQPETPPSGDGTPSIFPRRRRRG